jgi:hypothetical protein
MTSKVGWEKSSNGPDWIDVEMLMRAIATLHSGEVALIVSPAGNGFGTGVDVAASVLFNVLPGSSLPEGVQVHEEWPCSTHATLVAHVFSLLYQLDYKIGETYKQESLWK